MSEDFESIFMALPNGCSLKTPNSMSSKYQAVYKENSHKGSITAKEPTARAAVIRLAELLAENNIQLKESNNV